MSIRLQLKGRLHDLKLRRMELQTKIKSKLAPAVEKIGDFEYRPIDEIDIEGAVMLLKEVEEHKRDLLRVLGDIEKLEKELYD
jgi:hypothetical protein